MVNPRRGEIWLADLNPVRGHEQAGPRPVVILSENPFNAGPAGLTVVAPMTSTLRSIPLHVLIHAPEGGLKNDSVVLCDAVRSISKDRLQVAWGILSAASMAQVEDRLRVLLGL